VRSFGPKDALAEVEKVLALPEAERPVGLVFLITCDVSVKTRQQVRDRCGEEMECHFWVGTELDEKVKRHTDILEEFFADIQARVETTVSATVSHITDSTVITAGRDVYINVEREPSLPEPERVLAHRATLTHKAEYRRWADESADEHYIREESKILPLLASPYDDDTGQQREDLLQTIRAHDRLLVLGEPGMGKTVAMHRMMWETAQADDPVIPIFVPLIFFQGDLIDSVRVALNETDELRFDDLKTVRAFLRETRCLIMFDGLNEVPGKRREQAIGAIADFLRESPRHRYVVTSRSQDELWKKLRISGAIEDAVVIQRITDEQARGYLTAHLGDQRGRELHDRLNECLRGLSRTPLLLWLIKEAGLAGEELPGNRGELFDRFVDRMLARDVKLETVVALAIKKRALAHLAFTLQQAHQLACERERAEKIVAGVKSKHDGETILNEVLVHGLLQGERQVRFLHQSVQEYFVGVALCEAAQAESQAPTWQQVGRRLLRRNLVAWARDDWWAESFVQMAGLTKDSSLLVHELTPVKPWLAFWCSIEGKPVSEKTRAIVEVNTIARLHSKDAAQRLRAVRELGRFENPRTIEYLIEVLGDEDENVMNAAIQILIRLGEPAVEPLLTALHGSERVRWAATRVLGQIWEVTDLIKLGDSERDVRQRAAETLGRLGAQLEGTACMRVVVPLVAALKDNDDDVQREAAEALGELGEPAVAPLIAALEDDDWWVRSGATRALRKLGDTRAVEPLIAALRDEQELVRQDAVLALGQIWQLPDLTRLGSNDRSVRRKAAETLGKLRDTRAVEPLIAALKDKDKGVRRKAAEALGKLQGVQAVEPLIAALKDEHELVRQVALRALGQIWQLPRLAELGSSSRSMRREAVEALGKLRDARAVEPLIVALEDDDWWVRSGAARALRKLGDTRAVEPLIAVLRDEEELVRQHALRALGQIWQLPDLTRLGSNDRSVQEEAAEALGELGDTRAVEPLIAALKDKDKGVREKAAEALGKLGEPAVELLIATLGGNDEIMRWRSAWALHRIGTPEALAAVRKYETQEKQR
jgi:HEAT repeat protein